MRFENVLLAIELKKKLNSATSSWEVRKLMWTPPEFSDLKYLQKNGIPFDHHRTTYSCYTP